jgi:hypothetical protein
VGTRAACDADHPLQSLAGAQRRPLPQDGLSPRLAAAAAGVPQPHHAALPTGRHGSLPRRGLRRVPAARALYHQHTRAQRPPPSRRTAARRAAGAAADARGTGATAGAGGGRAHPGACGPLARKACPLLWPAQESLRSASACVAAPWCTTCLSWRTTLISCRQRDYLTGALVDQGEGENR